MAGHVFLETVNLTKRFGEILAVDSVSLRVNTGEIRGLIGENGSGKSTVS
jgi:ribose transport system ATP-binding protein